MRNIGMQRVPLAPRTLRARLVLAAGGSILAAVAVFVVVTVLIVGHQLRSSLDTALRQRAEEVSQLAVSAPAMLGEATTDQEMPSHCSMSDPTVLAPM